ncbi:MAG: ankyrin repeat domain-containing protein [Parerythrobacter sp.]
MMYRPFQSASRAVSKAGVLLAGLALLAGPAAAQMFTDGYEFLKAVRDRDGTQVTKALDEPGSVLVNTRDRTSGETALHIVTQRRDTSWIRFMTQRGANPNIADRNGQTPLMVASALGYVEGVEVLIKAGANVDVADSTGETPLIAAVHRRDLAMMKVLLASGADADRSDNSGRTARDFVAVMQANDQLADVLAASDKAREGEGDAAATYGPQL